MPRIAGCFSRNVNGDFVACTDPFRDVPAAEQAKGTKTAAGEAEGGSVSDSLIRDGSGFWFTCPLEKRKEARVYLKACEKYWGRRHMAQGLSDPGPSPEWLKEVQPTTEVA